MKRSLLAVASLAALACASSQAGTIFRCGNEYSTVPCADAKAIVVADAVTPAQRAEAREVARREKALAAEMTRDRREQEALARPALAGSLSAPRPAAAAPPSASKKHAKKNARKAVTEEERDFVATVRKAKKAGS